MSHHNSIRIDKNCSNFVQLLSYLEATGRLCITLTTLHKWSKSGILQAYSLSRRIDYKEDELMNALQ